MTMRSGGHHKTAESAKDAAHLAAKVQDGRTRIRAELYQEGAAKIRLPDTFDASMEAVLINTAGGLTGGDRMNWSVSAGAGDAHRCDDPGLREDLQGIRRNSRSRRRQIKVGLGARVDWLPQETILVRPRFVVLAGWMSISTTRAEFLAVEAILLGSQGDGRNDGDRDCFAIAGVSAASGRLIHAEELRLSDAVALR